MWIWTITGGVLMSIGMNLLGMTLPQIFGTILVVLGLYLLIRNMLE